MIYGFAVALLNLALLVAMLLLIAIGRRVGARHLKNDREGMRSGLGAVEAAVLGLLGLLLASPSPAPVDGSTSAASRLSRRATPSAMRIGGWTCCPPQHTPLSVERFVTM